jgi:uncharacterized protein DUF2844
MKNSQIIAGCMFFSILLAAGQPARAFLGGRADSAGTDQQSLKKVRRATTPLNGYTVEEVVYEATSVREFVSPAGIVFAIAWNGYVHPELMQLLGSYWNEYSTVRQKALRKSGSRRQQLATENIVVEKWGHMRNLHGRAYVPALVPEGVSIDEIK